MGQRVRERRHALGWSQERLADECGLHWSYIGQVERGQRNVGYLNLIRLAKALDAPVTRLVADE
jgi:transcriptional regulator with XRE-family HTH domain